MACHVVKISDFPIISFLELIHSGNRTLLFLSLILYSKVVVLSGMCQEDIKKAQIWEDHLYLRMAVEDGNDPIGLHFPGGSTFWVWRISQVVAFGCEPVLKGGQAAFHAPSIICNMALVVVICWVQALAVKDMLGSKPLIPQLLSNVSVNASA
eukprot:Gb_21770 [translate_table: standard]